jgi:hypothetical protein
MLARIWAKQFPCELLGFELKTRRNTVASLLLWARGLAILAVPAKAQVGNATAPGFANVRAMLAVGTSFATQAERRNFAQSYIDRRSTAFGRSGQTSSALLQDAAAIGILARASSIGESARKGHARTSRAILDQVLRAEPQSPWALALSGIWHLEGLRRGGAMASRLLGSNLATGLSQVRQAIRLADGERALGLVVAVTLLGLDARLYKAESRSLLNANAPTNQDPVEVAVTRGANKLLAALEAGDMGAIERLARSM